MAEGPCARAGAREQNTSSSPICRTLASFLATSYWRNNRDRRWTLRILPSRLSRRPLPCLTGNRSRFTLYRQMHKGEDLMAAADTGRQRTIRLVALLAMIGGSVGLASEAASDGEIKIGVLQP